MGLNSHLLTITEPTIKLEDIEWPDLAESEDGDHHSAFQGGNQPYIKINDYVFQPGEVDAFTLSLTGKYPEINATLADTRDVFAVSQLPRDGDVLSLKITMDFNDTYKDLRMDFHILEFRGFPVTTEDKNTNGSVYKVRAIAKIPEFYNDSCKSYGAANSYDHIISIAKDMKLGVATNVDATNDMMTRICAWQSKAELLEKTVLHSYVSDETFQTYSIDPYYYVNFVDVQKVFDAEEEVEMDELISAELFDERKGDPKEGSAEEKAQLILSNHHNIENTTNHIKSYNLINASTRVALENGYKRTMQYFDMNEEGGKVLEFDVESLVSSTIKDNEVALKGNQSVKEDEFETIIKHKYIGMQHSADNVHLHYAYSAINNVQNLVELDKMKLVVELDTTNPALYRYMKIPVTIYNYSNTSHAVANTENEKAKEAGFEVKQEQMESGKNQPKIEEDSRGEGHKVDEFLTGYYVIMGIEYKYSDDEGISQVLHLSRKEWPVRQQVVEKMAKKEEKKKGKLGSTLGAGAAVAANGK
jgi:hypothetical protein